MLKEPISCIILAGGRAKRFNGKDKGLIEFNNTPLIAHVINRVRHQVDDIIISANRNIDTYKQYASLVVTDQLENYQGPLAGIAAALPRCQHPWVLVLPCDIPLLPDDLVTILKPENDNRLHILKANDRLQLVFLMHQDLINTLNEYINQGHHKVMDWVALQNPFIIEVDNHSGAFTNLNTLDELKQLSE